MDNTTPKTQAPHEEQQNLDHEAHEPPATGMGSLAFLKSLAEISAVFVGFTYIGGWSYVASYYRTFGLNALELDLPLPVVCTTAVYMLFSASWPLFVIVALLPAWMLSVRRRILNSRTATLVALTILLLTVSIAGASHGRWQANHDMLSDSNELPNVAFSTRLKDADQPPCVGSQAYGSLDCKLLLHSKGIYFFFAPIRNSDESLTSGGNLNVYALADSDVTGIHILRGIK